MACSVVLAPPVCFSSTTEDATLMMTHTQVSPYLWPPKIHAVAMALKPAVREGGRSLCHVCPPALLTSASSPGLTGPWLPPRPPRPWPRHRQPSPPPTRPDRSDSITNG